MKENKKYTFKGKVIRSVFTSNEFSVYALDVDKDEYPDIKHNKYGNVSISGELTELSYDAEYDITAEETETKYGVGYKVINISREAPSSTEDVYNFLREILTENQATTIIKNYPDIIDRVKEDRLDDIDFNKLKGIKEKTFEKIKNKIITNYYLMDLVTEFKNILSLSMIKKIYNKYSSIELLREKLRVEPYTTLTRVSGIGFKKADAITLELQKQNIINFGYDVKTSPDRCLACLLYLLDENENEGHTKMSLPELRKQCLQLVPQCSNHFDEVINNENIYYNKDTMDIALRKTYETEYEIAQTILHNLNSNVNVWDYDVEKYRKVNGFDLSDEQLQAVSNICKYKISILNGAAGCVDCDTEFFDGTKWKPISEYKKGDKVLQYNEDGTAELVYPNAYIKNDAEYLWHFKTKNGLDQCISSNHMCYYETRWGVKRKEPFSKIKEIHERNGFTGKFLTSFKYFGTGINLSDDEIRLMVAVFADGCYVNKKENNYVRISVKKQRKVERIISILNRLNKQYTINKSKNGYTKIHFHVPFYAKHFPDSWYNCSYKQLEIISEEVMYWDGTFSSRERYTTSNKKDADFIQFVFTSVGYKASIEIRDRTGEKNIINNKGYIRKSIMYTVARSKINKISMSVETRADRNFGKTQIEKYKTKDGFEYCFNVPSHLLVLRRNNRIFITGNCGKSMSVKGIINMLEDNKKIYKLFTPTGKSSKVLAEFTGRTATTIHRGLGYNPAGEPEWTFNKEHKLYADVIIVDEFSMVDVKLFKRLIDAIDFRYTRLLMIGDNAQLCSVGCGNLLHDFMETKLIPTVTLTKVFRYGEGGLMRIATDARFCKPYLNNDMKHKMTMFGDNKDYTFVDLPSDIIPQNVVALYKKLLNKGYSIEDIQVLTAKNVGECGTITLNNMIQKIANPNYGSEVCMKVGEITYYEGDLIIQTQNNYNAEMDLNHLDEETRRFYENQEEAPTAFVANGESGIIKEIYTSYIIIDFDGIYVKYYRSDMNMIKLGYSISIHKSQGSSIKVVILCTPQSHTFMMNSNLIYVGLTRMKEMCYHLGTLSSVNKAVTKKANLTRNTFMQYLLTTMKKEEYKNIVEKVPSNNYNKQEIVDKEDFDIGDELPFL